MHTVYGMLSLYLMELNQVSWWWNSTSHGWGTRGELQESKKYRYYRFYTIQSCRKHRGLLILTRIESVYLAVDCFLPWKCLVTQKLILLQSCFFFFLLLSNRPHTTRCASRSKWSFKEAMKVREAVGWTVLHLHAWSSWLRLLWVQDSAHWSTWQEV